MTASHDEAPLGPRVLFVNRSYWPDAEATGQLLTELCEDLVARHQIDARVLAGQPNHNPAGLPFRRIGRQRRLGVEMLRVPHLRLPKRKTWGRLLNQLSFLIAGFPVGYFYKPRPDILVVETDPPLLAVLGSWLKRWYGCPLVLYLQDIYPEVAVALGAVGENSAFTKLMRTLLHKAYRQADHVVVLSDDMKQFIIDGVGVRAERVSIVPNWADTDKLRPMKTNNLFRKQHHLTDEFVVMYSGNLGLSQRLEQMLAVAERLKDRQDIVFLMIGEGAAKSKLMQQADDLKLSNIKFLPYQPKNELSHSLSAADMHWVTLDPAIMGFLMPSKIYGILASGTASMVAGAPECELSRLVEKNQVGKLAKLESVDDLTRVIQWSADHRDEVSAMGRRARELAVRFDRQACTDRFANVLYTVARSAPPAPLGYA